MNRDNYMQASSATTLEVSKGKAPMFENSWREYNIITYFRCGRKSVLISLYFVIKSLRQQTDKEEIFLKSEGHHLYLMMVKQIPTLIIND